VKTCVSWLAAAGSVALAASCASPAASKRAASDVPGQMETSRAELLRWLDAVDKDVFQPGHFRARDEVVLKDGTTLTGKLLDYGPYIGVVDQTQRHILKRDEAKKITASWGDAPPAKPQTPDLDVTFIERLPRYRGNHGNVGYDTKEKGVFLQKPNSDPAWPPAGTKATFKAHVVNKGPVASKPFRYEWLMDGKADGQGTHDALPPGAETVIDHPWVWRDGAHTVTFQVLPEGPDFSVWDNRHSDRTDSLGLSFVAAKSTYDGFDGALNMVESFSYEDWVQYHLQVMNFLFAASIYPGSPGGCEERVRIDVMNTYPDDEYQKKAETTGKDEQGYWRHEGKWGFSPWDQYPLRAANIDWGLIHELGHQLGIIDYYTLDFWRFAILARDKNGALIDVGYSYPYTGMMRGHGPHAFEEVTAVAMNLERGKHRGYFGDYLFYLPRQCGIRILDFNGRPLPGAEVRIFRRTAGVHTEDTGQIMIPENPVFTGTTDADGVYWLPNEKPPFVFTTDNGFTRGPGPFGDALVISDTGLMLIEIWAGERRDAQFTDVTEFAIGCGRGHADKYVQDIPTILPGAADQVKPPQIAPLETDGWCDRFKLRWNDVAKNTAVKFRIYTMLDGLPFTRTSMHEVATVGAETAFALSAFHLSGWLTMTGIDEAGHESAPAPPVYVGQRCLRKLAVNSQGEVFTADWALQRIDASGMVRLFTARSGRGAWPATAIAIGPQDEVVALSQDAAGVCVFGLDGRRKALFGAPGSQDGQLKKPSDVACDAAGSVYVADTDNDRIAVFKATGEFVVNVGAGKLARPVGVAVGPQGDLYVIQDKKPGLVKIPKTGGAYGEPVPLAESTLAPLDVVCDGAGRIYVTQNADPGLTVLDADGKTVATLAKWGEESLRGLPALAFDRRGVLVCSRGDRGGILRIPVSEIH
jgi:hypothetical protein